MGFVREPKGVDFIIKSEPLTEKERKEISKFIAAYKANSKQEKSKKLTYKTSKQRL
jgi:hypothetical protein